MSKKLKAKRGGPFEVSKKTLDKREVVQGGGMHRLANGIDGMGDIRSSKSGILKSTNNGAKFSGIVNRYGER